MTEETLTLEAIKVAVNELLVVVATAFILLMQLGFALVENGSVRSKNSKNILIKNLFDACAGALAFWLVGFGLAFGQTEEKGRFAGDDPDLFAASGFRDISDTNYYLLWIFQFSFAATSSTIVSGSLAERTKLPAYMAFSSLMTGIIYPVIVSWCWGGGWLGDGDDGSRGFHDFAGTGIVHMVGGVAGFCGALVIGPRHGKEKNANNRRDVTLTQEFRELKGQQVAPAEFEEWVKDMANDVSFEQNSYPFVVYGTILLWVSWLFFNGGSTLDMFVARENNTPKIMMVTIISAVTAGLTAAFLKPLIMCTYSKRNRYDVGAMCNGLLAGLVAITGICDRCEPWSAFIIGLIGGIVYILACKLMHCLNIDDPIEASQVHGFTGIWGCIAVGIFDNEKGLVASDAEDKGGYLGWQVLGMLCIVAWVAVISLLYFFIMKKLGLLRVPLLEEIIGLDHAEMGSQIKVQMKIAEGIVRKQTLNFHRRDSFANSPTFRKSKMEIAEALAQAEQQQKPEDFKLNVVQPVTSQDEINSARGVNSARALEIEQEAK